MINIQPIRAFSDNYIWAIVNEDNKQLVVVDPGQAQPVIDFIEAYKLELKAMLITHKHADHIGGVKELTSLYPHTHLIANSAHGVNQNQKVSDGSSLRIWGLNTEVWQVAGHTHNHLAYILNLNDVKHVFCGDTLFSAGCGRVFTGDMQAMHNSLQRLNTLPENTLFYPAHEYTASNLRFGLHIEPNNTEMQQWLTKVEKLVEEGNPSLPTTLAVERLINVFLRVSEPSVIDSLQQKLELANVEPLTVFTELRRLKDSF